MVQITSSCAKKINSDVMYSSRKGIILRKNREKFYFVDIYDNRSSNLSDLLCVNETGKEFFEIMNESDSFNIDNIADRYMGKMKIADTFRDAIYSDISDLIDALLQRKMLICYLEDSDSDN